MSKPYFLIAMSAGAALLAGCTPQAGGPGSEIRGVAALHVPVVTSRVYAFDMRSADGMIAADEAQRLDGWFRSLGLGYGDRIQVEGQGVDMVRTEVARVAARYGMMVEAGSPVMAGAPAPGQARVVVSRTRAEVPGCPDWSRMSQPSVGNAMMSNFGCGVNSALAQMIADPNDLVRGREGSGVVDAATATKAVDVYRKAPTTGAGGLKETTAKGDK